MNHVASALLALVRAALCEEEISAEELEALSPENLTELYALSKSHDMAHIVGEGLTRFGIPMEEAVASRFLKQQMLSVYRCERLQDAFTRLSDLFEASKIPYMPLKGAVIRPYYPQAWMRTSCDIDILIHEEDLERAIDRISSTFDVETVGDKNYHDVSIYLNKAVHLELHFHIKENIPSMDTLLLRVWEYARLKEGTSYCYLQTNEFLLFHLVAHNAYHFVKGGCGIRPFMDWWLLKQKLSYDKTLLEQLLSDADLKDFALGMDALSDVWFSKMSHTPLTLEMESYILGAGIYGSKDNEIVLAREKSGGRIKYVLKRIFMPYSSLKNMYPKLVRFPILYPFYTVKRWIDSLLKGKGKRAVKELQRSTAPKSEREIRMAKMCRELNLIK